MKGMEHAKQIRSGCGGVLCKYNRSYQCDVHFYSGSFLDQVKRVQFAWLLYCRDQEFSCFCSGTATDIQTWISSWEFYCIKSFKQMAQ